jgi:hypothetical protein
MHSLYLLQLRKEQFMFGCIDALATNVLQPGTLLRYEGPTDSHVPLGLGDLI